MNSRFNGQSFERAQAWPLADFVQTGNGAGHCLWRHGMTNQIALRLAAMQVAKRMQLFDSFDTFCHYIKTKRVGHGDNCFNE